MVLFLENGYEATSLRALESSTGVDRKGIYNAFGDKEGLFVVALERFIELGSRQYAALAEAEGAAFPEIKTIFGNIVEYSQTELGQSGCLVCNSIREPIGASAQVRPVLEGYLGRTKAAFHHALTNELAEHSIPSTAVDRLANGLLGTFLGAFVLARAPVNKQVIIDLVELALGQTETQLGALKSGRGLDTINL